MSKHDYKYPLVMRIFHWSMALLILALIAIGWYMHGLPKDDPNKYFFYPWHKSFGMLVLFLWPVRAIVKAIARAPLKSGLSDEQMKLAHLGHILIYILMLLVPVSGYIMSTAGGHGVKFFGFALPNLLQENESLAGWAHMVHEYLPWVLLCVVGVHVAAVVRHKMYDNVNVLKRML